VIDLAFGRGLDRRNGGVLRGGAARVRRCLRITRGAGALGYWFALQKDQQPTALLRSMQSLRKWSFDDAVVQFSTRGGDQIPVIVVSASSEFQRISETMKETHLRLG
jgi:hypothetical protein